MILFSDWTGIDSMKAGTIYWGWYFKGVLKITWLMLRVDLTGWKNVDNWT